MRFLQNTQPGKVFTVPPVIAELEFGIRRQTVFAVTKTLVAGQNLNWSQHAFIDDSIIDIAVKVAVVINATTTNGYFGIAGIIINGGE